MVITWIIGFTVKAIIPAGSTLSYLTDSISGLVIPVLCLTIFEIYYKVKGSEDPGYEKMLAFKDPEADKEPSEKMKKATKSFSLLAINCFLITLGIIGLMLIGLLLVGDAKTVNVSGIVLAFVGSIFALIVIYVIYRIIDRAKNKS